MSPDELDAIRERDKSDQHWNRGRLNEGDKDRHALLGLVDELLERQVRVTGLLESWTVEEREYHQMIEYGIADGIKLCTDELREALWPKVT